MSWIREYVSRVFTEYVVAVANENPVRFAFEAGIVILVLWLAMRKSYDPKSNRLSKKEEQALIDEWAPEPLLDKSLVRDVKEEPLLIVDSVTGPVVKVNGTDALNWAASNFLGLASSKEIKEAAHNAIVKYGIGSCGPRGFYGSIDVHIELETAMAKFFGAQESILYSDGLACLASVIPAFAKRDDLIICDEGVNYAISQGIQLSRSNVLYFKHNDMTDLRRVLDSVREKDKKASNPKLVRRFIVVEGLYQYHGDICPLNELVALKNEYRYRLLVDDSVALGVLGKTGKGTYEHFNVPLSEIDIMCGTLDHTIASVGGWCIGKEKSVVDHQRLSGAGYCFSASSPPYCSAAAMVSFSLIVRNGAALVASLAERAGQMHAAMHEALKGAGLTINGRAAGTAAPVRAAAGTGTAASGTSASMVDVKTPAVAASDFAADPSISPILHIRLARPLDSTRKVDRKLMAAVARTMMETYGIAVTAPKYIESKSPEASIRVYVTSDHTTEQVRQTVTALRRSFRTCLRVLLSNTEDELASLQSAAEAQRGNVSSPLSRVGGGAGATADLKLDMKSSAAAAAAVSDWPVSESSLAITKTLSERIAWLTPVVDRLNRTAEIDESESVAFSAGGGTAAAGTSSTASATRTKSKSKSKSNATAAAAADAEVAPPVVRTRSASKGRKSNA